MTASVAPQGRVAPLDVGQVHAMLEAGILADHEPIELIDGVLVYKDRSALGEDPMTVGRKHNLVVGLLIELNPDLSKFGCYVQAQGPLTLPPHNEPEPDGVILYGGGPRDYRDRLPGAADAAAVIEVADSSLAYDRGKKLSVYARAAIPQYVIVNLQESCIELYEDPAAAEGRYRRTTVIHAGETLVFQLGVHGALTVAAERLLP